MNRVVADLNRLVELGDAARMQNRADVHGRGQWVVAEGVCASQVHFERDPDGIRITGLHNGRDGSRFSRFEDCPSLTRLEWSADVVGFPSDWRSFDQLVVSVTNGPRPLELDVTIFGATGRLAERRALQPSERATLAIELVDLPLAQGIEPAFQAGAIRVSMFWRDDGGPRFVAIHSVELSRRREGGSVLCVDGWGQRRSRNWPGKVRANEDLVEDIREENERLAKMPVPGDRCRFGGWLQRGGFRASGFFRVEQDANGCWWYVDPDGHAFWSVGFTGVRMTDYTPVAGRRELYEVLPDPHGPEADMYDELGRLSFFRWNALRKWKTYEAWRDQVFRRYRAMGHTTIANWSDPMMVDQQVVPHVRNVNTTAPAECRCHGSFYDVWDARWTQAFDEACRQTAATQRDNPWLIGYFVDNEKPWQNMRLLEAKPDAALRDEWSRFVSERCQDVQVFNRLMGVHCRTWHDVRALRNDELKPVGEGQALLDAFERHYAETYFRNVSTILRRHDPNHLYLGCRFVGSNMREDVVRIAGKYVDVLSVNSYSGIPDRSVFDELHRWSGRPLQIGEHHLPGLDARQLPPIWPAFTPTERRVGAVQYDHAVAAMPYGIGSHWFQFCDQPVTGRWSNGECHIIGLVDITDQLHADIFDAACEVGRNVYAWHAEAR